MSLGPHLPPPPGYCLSPGDFYLYISEDVPALGFFSFPRSHHILGLYNFSGALFLHLWNSTPFLEVSYLNPIIPSLPLNFESHPSLGHNFIWILTPSSFLGASPFFSLKPCSFFFSCGPPILISHGFSVFVCCVCVRVCILLPKSMSLYYSTLLPQFLSLLGTLFSLHQIPSFSSSSVSYRPFILNHWCCTYFLQSYLSPVISWHHLVSTCNLILLLCLWSFLISWDLLSLMSL